MEFGELKYLEPNSVWSNERHFSAWLKENIESLSDELGIEIEEIELESAIGSFHCDLLGIEVSSGRHVVIENQFGPTNHDHLGKLLTYSAGKDASIVIWIAQEFRGEHLSVMDWLNRRTEEGVSLFGVKIEVLQIDKSNPVPIFKVLVRPDEWERSLRTEGLSERQIAYLEFFGTLLKELKSEVPGFTTATKALPQNWFWVGAGKTGLGFTFSFGRGNRYRVELYITTGTRERNKEIFDSLYAEKDEIEKETGILSWERIDQKKDSRIAAYFTENIDVLEIHDDEAKRDLLVSWSLEMAKKFKTSFGPRIEML